MKKRKITLLEIIERRHDLRSLRSGERMEAISQELMSPVEISVFGSEHYFVCKAVFGDLHINFIAENSLVVSEICWLKLFEIHAEKNAVVPLLRSVKIGKAAILDLSPLHIAQSSEEAIQTLERLGHGWEIRGGYPGTEITQIIRFDGCEIRFFQREDGGSDFLGEIVIDQRSVEEAAGA